MIWPVRRGPEHPTQPDEERAQRFRAALREADPAFAPKLRQLRELGLVQGWRSVLRVRINMKDIT